MSYSWIRLQAYLQEWQQKYQKYPHRTTFKCYGLMCSLPLAPSVWPKNNCCIQSIILHSIRQTLVLKLLSYSASEVDGSMKAFVYRANQWQGSCSVLSNWLSKRELFIGLQGQYRTGAICIGWYWPATCTLYCKTPVMLTVLKIWQFAMS